MVARSTTRKPLFRKKASAVPLSKEHAFDPPPSDLDKHEIGELSPHSGATQSGGYHDRPRERVIPVELKAGNPDYRPIHPADVEAGGLSFFRVGFT